MVLRRDDIVKIQEREYRGRNLDYLLEPGDGRDTEEESNDSLCGDIEDDIQTICYTP